MLQSLDRGLEIMKYLLVHSNVSVSEIAEVFDISMSTASRILNTLAEHDIAYRNERNKKFQLGIGVLAFAYHFQNENHALETARPVMQKLMEITGESVHLGVRYQRKSYMLAQIRSPANRNMREAVTPGRELPAYCTAAGKILLTWQKPDRIDEVLSQPLHAYTANTITDPQVLKDCLEKIRSCGLAFDRGEMMENVFCMAVPVRDTFGEVKYSIGLTGKTDFQANPEHCRHYSLYLQQAARELSAKLPQVFRGGFAQMQF